MLSTTPAYKPAADSSRIMTEGQFKMGHTNFNDLELPETVFKYRDWNKSAHQSILTHRQVWFAAPSSFDDPLDCKNPIRYDLLKEVDIYNKYLFESKKIPEHSKWNRQQHRKFARDWTKKSPMKNKKYVEEIQQKAFHIFDIRFGVLSLTADPKNIDMWKAYSADSTGFCVGFNPKVAFRPFGGAGEVNYVDVLPIIMPTPTHRQEVQHVLQVFSKLKKWSFEKEYRAHKFQIEPATDEDRTIDLSEEAYSEIIFGSNMSSDVKNEIRESCKKSLPKIIFRQAQIADVGEINIVTV